MNFCFLRALGGYTFDLPLQKKEGPMTDRASRLIVKKTSRLPCGGEDFYLGGCGDDAELLHEALSVPVDEAFDNLAAGDASNGYAGDGDVLPGWGNAVEITFVGATAGPAGHDGFAFGDDILDGQVKIGEGIAVVTALRIRLFYTPPGVPM
jgi:hypothetical protein